MNVRRNPGLIPVDILRELLEEYPNKYFRVTHGEISEKFLEIFLEKNLVEFPEEFSRIFPRNSRGLLEKYLEEIREKFPGKTWWNFQ